MAARTVDSRSRPTTAPRVSEQATRRTADRVPKIMLRFLGCLVETRDRHEAAACICHRRLRTHYHIPASSSCTELHVTTIGLGDRLYMHRACQPPPATQVKCGCCLASFPGLFPVGQSRHPHNQFTCPGVNSPACSGRVQSPKTAHNHVRHTQRDSLVTICQHMRSES